MQKVVRKTSLSSFNENLEKKENVDIVIVICAKNESNTIGKLIDEINSSNLPFSYKILVVNDGSTDDTAKIARAKGALVINHVYNLGIGGAIKTGFLACKILNPEIVITAQN